MIARIVKVSEKGQIAIPKEMREAANITQGDELLLFSQDGRIFLEKTEDVLGEWAEDLSDFRRLGMERMMKVWDNEADRAWAAELERKHRAGEFPVLGSARREGETGARRVKR